MSKACLHPPRFRIEPFPPRRDDVDLLNEVKNVTFNNVRNLLTDRLSDEAISRGIGKLKYPSDPEAASSYSVDFSDIFEGIFEDFAAEDIRFNLGGQMRASCAGGCEMARFLNRVVDRVRKRHGIPCNGSASREYSCRFGYETSSIPDMEAGRKPDVVVMDLCRSRLKRGMATWGDVRAVFAQRLFATDIGRSSLFKQLLTFAREIFRSQTVDRRFVLGVALTGLHVTLYCFDRSGVVSSESFSIAKDPDMLIRIIVGMVFVDAVDLGYDPSIVRKNGRVYALVNKNRYLVKNVLYLDGHLVGKGVVCLLAERRRKEYVIKDSWIPRASRTFEHEVLERIRGVENVIQIVEHEVCTVGGEVDSTETHRRALMEEARWRKEDILDHHRIVITPFGESLKNFSSLVELVSAIKDLMKAIKGLAERDVVHRDISSHNVILVPSADPAVPLRRGCLIDFDAANYLVNFTCQRPRGTTPFMALEVLKAVVDGTRIEHKYHHDLESVFYLLCYTCISQAGPWTNRRARAFVAQSEIAKWSGRSMGWPGDDMEVVYKHKRDVMHNGAEFERCVLAEFAPYFRDLYPCVRAFRKVLFENCSGEDVYSEEEIDEWGEIGEERTQECSVPWCERERDVVFDSLFEILDGALVVLRTKAKYARRRQGLVSGYRFPYMR